MGSFPPEEMPVFFASADALLVTLKDTKIFKNFENKNFEKGWKLEYQSREESSNLRDVWSISDYFIDNQTSEILYLEEVRYLDEMQYLDNIFNPSSENNPSKIIKIKPFTKII